MSDSRSIPRDAPTGTDAGTAVEPTDDGSTALGFAIDAAVAAVPGVQRLFAADPAALRALQQVAGGGEAQPSSTVRPDAVVVNVAIDDSRTTRELCDELTALVRRVAGEVSVEIRVSRIHVDAV